MKDKRSRPRIKISLPVQVIGRTISGEKFREFVKTEDASSMGTRLILDSPVAQGTTLLLIMQMPNNLRLYDFTEPSYQTYAKVRRIDPQSEGGWRVGLSFLGKYPPQGSENYQSKEFFNIELKTPKRPPTGAYPLPTKAEVSTRVTASHPVAEVSVRPTPAPFITNTLVQQPKPVSTLPIPPRRESTGDKRSEDRHNIPIDVMVEFFNSIGQTIAKEQGLATNISRHGACVITTKEAQIGSKVQLSLIRDGFVTTSQVKASIPNSGGIWKLHLQFIDKCWEGAS